MYCVYTGIAGNWPEVFEERMKVLYSLIVFAPWLGQEPLFEAGERSNADRGRERLAGKWAHIFTDVHLGLFNALRDIWTKRNWGTTNPEMSSMLALFEALLPDSGMPWQLAPLGYQIMEAKNEMTAVKKNEGGGAARVQKFWKALFIKELLSEGLVK